MSSENRIGLILTGGGARGAYQAGALRALGEIAREMGNPQPFPVLSGVSAGSINAAYLAGHADNAYESFNQLEALWTKLSTDKVFRVDFLSAIGIGIRWVGELVSGGWIPKRERSALLDTSPLRELLLEEIDWERLDKNIRNDLVHSLSIAAVNYGDGSSHTFYQSHYHYPRWKRVRRHAEPTTIAPDHILASTAIPFLFPPTKIGEWYFGDGSLRNQTPLSSAIKLGANRLIVIGVRHDQEKEAEPIVHRPSQGRIFSVLLNSLFLDALDLDVERLERINETLKYVPATAPTELRPIPITVIRPSRDIGTIALEEAHHMPRVTRWLLKGLGTPKETAGLISYLLFEKAYTTRLAKLGYEDTIAMREELRPLFTV